MKVVLALGLLIVVPGCERGPENVPAERPAGLAAAALRDRAFTWQTRETDHFRIHVQPGSYAADHLDRLVEDAEQARTNALRVLGARAFGPRIDVFYLTSREQMKRLTGFPVRGWTDPEARTVLLVRSGGSSQGERHEIAHVLSHNLWGHSRDWLTTGWMSEALATYAGGPCGGYSLDQIVAFLDRRGELIPLASLAPKFRAYDDLVAYLQAGSFIGYVREAYGLAAVRALWEQGFERFETILGKTPAVVDAEWRDHVRASTPEAEVGWAGLQKRGCE